MGAATGSDLYVVLLKLDVLPQLYPKGRMAGGYLACRDRGRVGRVRLGYGVTVRY
jgi:hypothetical protein